MAAATIPIIPTPPRSFAEVLSGNRGEAPLSPRSFSKSFDSVLSNGGKLQFKPPSFFRGEPAVFFSKEDIDTLASPFRFTLIGKFSYWRPSMEIIRKFFTSLGLKGLKSVGLLQDNHVAIFINNEEDYSRLLLRSIWYISGAPMKVLKWSPDFVTNVESPVVPVWVAFPGLPIHFFDKSALFNLASAFGTPLKVDEPTALLSRPTVARVCIELDVSKTKNHRLWIGEEKVGFWQDVVYENPPVYCEFCKMLGHDVVSCYAKNPELKKKKEKSQKEEEEPVAFVPKPVKDIHLGLLKPNGTQSSSVLFENGEGEWKTQKSKRWRKKEISGDIPVVEPTPKGAEASPTGVLNCNVNTNKVKEKEQDIVLSACIPISGGIPAVVVQEVGMPSRVVADEVVVLPLSQENSSLAKVAVPSHGFSLTPFNPKVSTVNKIGGSIPFVPAHNFKSSVTVERETHKGQNSLTLNFLQIDGNGNGKDNSSDKLSAQERGSQPLISQEKNKSQPAISNSQSYCHNMSVISPTFCSLQLERDTNDFVSKSQLSLTSLNKIQPSDELEIQIPPAESQINSGRQLVVTSSGTKDLAQEKKTASALIGPTKGNLIGSDSLVNLDLSSQVGTGQNFIIDFGAYDLELGSSLPPVLFSRINKSAISRDETSDNENWEFDGIFGPFLFSKEGLFTNEIPDSFEGMYHQFRMKHGPVKEDGSLGDDKPPLIEVCADANIDTKFIKSCLCQAILVVQDPIIEEFVLDSAEGNGCVASYGGHGVDFLLRRIRQEDEVFDDEDDWIEQSGCSTNFGGSDTEFFLKKKKKRAQRARKNRRNS